MRTSFQSATRSFGNTGADRELRPFARLPRGFVMARSEMRPSMKRDDLAVRGSERERRDDALSGLSFCELAVSAPRASVEPDGHGGWSILEHGLCIIMSAG